MALVPFPNKAVKPDPDDDWDDESSPSEGKMSFLDHLDELRKRLIYMVVSIVVGLLVACLFLQYLFDFVMTPIKASLGPGQQLIYTEPTEGLMIWVKIALIGGILIASPGVMAQVWLFIAPGLYVSEKKLAIPFVVLSSIFFVTGAAFAHYLVFPLTLKFLGSFSTDAITFMPRIEPTFSLYMQLILTFGLIFELPTIVLFLARMGLVTARFLLRHSKYAILIAFVVGAVLSPGTDPIGQIAMAGPMVLLYFIGILLAWIFGKKRKPETAESDA